MKLRVMTPTEVVLDEEVIHVTAEDPSGSLGIRPGHTGLVTALVPGLVTARSAGGTEQYVAVDGGVLLVSDDGVDIVSRQAVAGSDMRHLEDTVIAGFERDAEDDRTNHAAFEKMRIKFLKGIVDFDRAEAG